MNQFAGTNPVHPVTTCQLANPDSITFFSHNRGMKKKLDSKIVEHLKVAGPKRVHVWDTALQGFGLRVSPTGRKVWFVAVRSSGRTRRVTVGTYLAQMLHEAREQARKIIRDAQLGVFEDNEISALTLGETLPLFIQLHAKPKNRTWKRLISFSAFGKWALNFADVAGSWSHLVRRFMRKLLLRSITSCRMWRPREAP